MKNAQQVDGDDALTDYWYDMSDLTIFDAAFWMVIGSDPRLHHDRYAQDHRYATDFEDHPGKAQMVHEKCEVIISAGHAQKPIPITAETRLNDHSLDARRTRILKSAWIDWCRNNGYSELADRFAREQQPVVDGADTVAKVSESLPGADGPLGTGTNDPGAANLTGDAAQAAGIDKQGILAYDWPLLGNFNQDSLSAALSDVPKWLLPARVSEGAPGKASALWNPAQVAVCLVEKRYTNAKALTTHIRNHFPDWFGEWETKQEHL